jgi:hypothetical protein
MKPRSFTAVAILLVVSTIGLAQCDFYQVRYAKNLTNADSIVDIVNTGASAPSNICVNVYGISKGKLIHCCSCLVTPDQLVSLSVQKDLLANNNFPPDSMVIKLISTFGSTASDCDASKTIVTTGNGSNVASGMASWGTGSQPLSQFSLDSSATETPFTISHLSTPEATSLTTQCTPARGAGAICNSCK